MDGTPTRSRRAALNGYNQAVIQIEFLLGDE
jgi:hypothetical protein